MGISGDEPTFGDDARLDWVYIPDDRFRRLHAVGYWWHEIPGYESSALGFTGCDIPTRLDIPGVFSRMGKPRCGKCCKATGMPPGAGSPKNDAACRKILGLEVA